MNNLTRIFIGDVIETVLFFAMAGGIGLIAESFLPGVGVVFVCAAGLWRYWPSK
jgi:hypothetical protein